MALADSALQKADKFLSDYGADLSPALIRWVQEHMAKIAELKMGADRKQLKSTAQELWDFLSNKPLVVAHIHKLFERARMAGIPTDDPSDAFYRTVAPIREALRGRSWDAVVREYQKLPPIFKFNAAENDKDVFAAIDSGNSIANSMETSEGLPALAAIQESLLRGDWQGVSANIDALRKQEATLRATYETKTKAVVPGLDPTCVRILSIDGGGIRGIIPALFLQELEQRTHKRVSELFDYIVGTSTGGILALGVSVPNPDGSPKYEAKDLVRLYSDEGANIFPHHHLASLKGLIGPKYGSDGIEPVLKRYFGEKVFLKQALTRVIVPTYVLEAPHRASGQLQRHKFLNSYGDESIWLYMWEVARAASAAPTYFPPFRIPLPKVGATAGDDSEALIDAGVFANNPTAYALTSVRDQEFRLKYIDRFKSRFLIVSLGTGQAPRSLSYEKAYGWGLLSWAEPLSNIAFSDPGTEDANRDLVGQDDYYIRMQPTIDPSIAALDNASEENVAALKSAARGYIESSKQDFDTVVTQLLRKRPRACAQNLVSNLEKGEFPQN